MQGKDRSEQETKTKSTVGIDVCKLWLDIHILPSEEAFRVPNTKAGSKEIIRRLAHHDVAVDRNRGDRKMASRPPPQSG